MPETAAEDRILNAKAAAKFLGDVKLSWLLRDGIRRYGIPHYRPPGSKKILFKTSDLFAVLDKWREQNGELGPRPGTKRTPKPEVLVQRVVKLVGHDPGINRAELRRALKPANRQLADEAIAEALKARRIKVKQDDRGWYLYFPAGREKGSKNNGDR